MSRPPRPPGGGAPPETAELDGEKLELVPLATEIARRHRAEFPDEEERYGERGLEWCIHDNQWLLSWASIAAAGWLDFPDRVAWLAGILESRGYPVARLARDLEIAAEVAGGAEGSAGPRLSEVLLSGRAALQAV